MARWPLIPKPDTKVDRRFNGWDAGSRVEGGCRWHMCNPQLAGKIAIERLAYSEDW